MKRRHVQSPDAVGGFGQLKTMSPMWGKRVRMGKKGHPT